MAQITNPKRQFARMLEAEASPVSAATQTPPEAAAEDPAPFVPKPVSKTARIVTLMQRSEGASLDEMVAVTGWLPHTMRAALTGLRKKGLVIAKSKADGVTRYTVATAS